MRAHMPRLKCDVKFAFSFGLYAWTDFGVSHFAVRGSHFIRAPIDGTAAIDSPSVRQQIADSRRKQLQTQCLTIKVAYSLQLVSQ